MAFPVIETDTSGALGGAGGDVTLPSGIAAGNRIVVAIASDVASGSVTPPAGFGLIIDTDDLAGSTGTSWQIYEKKSADGTEGGTTVTFTGPSFGIFASIRISGHDSALAGQAAGALSAVAGAPNPPNLTPTGGAKDYLWIEFGASGNGVDGVSANYSLVEDAGGFAFWLVASRNLNAASENPGTMGNNLGTGWVAQTLAIHPAGAAAGTVGPLLEGGSHMHGKLIRGGRLVP